MAHHLSRITGQPVRALLQDREDEHKARLDARRRDVQLVVGDEALLTRLTHPYPGSPVLLSPRWMGPFKVVMVI